MGVSIAHVCDSCGKSHPVPPHDSNLNKDAYTYLIRVLDPNYGDRMYCNRECLLAATVYNILKSGACDIGYVIDIVAAGIAKARESYPRRWDENGIFLSFAEVERRQNRAVKVVDDGLQQ